MIYKSQLDGAIDEKIAGLLNEWHYNSIRLGLLISFLGVVAIGGSLFVTTFLGYSDNDYHIPNIVFKVVSFISAASLTTLSSFNIVQRKNAFRHAWRVLSNAYLKFKAKEINELELINVYKECELSIGNVKINLSDNYVRHSSEF
jgi:hypothetical protein